VSAIKREGGRLLVRFRDLVPEFVDAVKQKLYPNRSVAIRPDYSLAHVGFLGGKAPAVPGLAAIGLAEDAALISITTKEEETMILTDKIKQLFGLAEELGAKIEIPAVIKPEPEAKPAAKTYSEEAVAQAVAAATEKARAEERKKVEAETAAATRKQSVAAFCEGLKQKGHLILAWEKAGIRTFMERLAEREEPATFAEGGEKQTPLAWFQAFLEGLPKLVTFEEIVKPEKITSAAQLSETQRRINKQMGVADEVVVKFAQEED
jgi:hypothetical protein